MADRLLVRVFNVGFGECIYLCVPDLNREVHILIDCGSKGELEQLSQRIADLENLPEVSPGRKRLDLLVVTHPHKDHITGFKGNFFKKKNIEIKHIWLSPAFDRLNPKAEGFHALQDAVQRGLHGLADSDTGEGMKGMKDKVLELYAASNEVEEVIPILRNTMPAQSKPLYVSAGTSAGELKIFGDPEISLSVLGPMEDLDAYYLGGAGLPNVADKDSVRGTTESYLTLFQPDKSRKIPQPVNISAQDFKQLRSRIYANVLAAAEVAGHIVNNMSVILLLKWHKQRLLFTGDAEFNTAFKGEAKIGRCNGSWNVMWAERKVDLSEKLDFLKVGHHGSITATPWVPKGSEEHPMNILLNNLLPPGKHPTARAVVSTERGPHPSIPDLELMKVLGARVAADSRSEYTEIIKGKKEREVQPKRTDLEAKITGNPNNPIEFKFDRK